MFRKKLLVLTFKKNIAATAHLTFGWRRQLFPYSQNTWVSLPRVGTAEHSLRHIGPIPAGGAPRGRRGGGGGGEGRDAAGVPGAAEHRHPEAFQRGARSPGRRQ